MENEKYYPPVLNNEYSPSIPLNFPKNLIPGNKLSIYIQNYYFRMNQNLNFINIYFIIRENIKIKSIKI